MFPATVTDGVRPRVTSPRADSTASPAEGPDADPAASAQPGSAQPESIQPESAQPESAHPGPAAPETTSSESEGHQVWRQYLRGHATVARALEAELLLEEQLSLAAFDVLAELAEAPQRSLRMTELADAVLLSRSGVTRMVDRLERLGLVTRGRVLEDGRGIAATLSEQGADLLKRASVTHRDAVRRYFVNRLDESDLRDLRRISQRLITGPAAPSPDGTDATV